MAIFLGFLASLHRCLATFVALCFLLAIVAFCFAFVQFASTGPLLPDFAYLFLELAFFVATFFFLFILNLFAYGFAIISFGIAGFPTFDAYIFFILAPFQASFFILVRYILAFIPALSVFFSAFLPQDFAYFEFVCAFCLAKFFNMMGSLILITFNYAFIPFL